MASPITVQTRNPGAITDGSWARSQPGYVGANGDFAVFDTPDSGRAAQLKLLNNYVSSGHNSVSAIINKWAPQASNSPGSTGNYAEYVAKRVGVDPNAPLTPDQLGSVATAQQEWESGLKKNGFTPPSSAASAPDTSKALDDIFGTPAATPADPATAQSLDSVFGPDTNAFGTTSKPGTPQFAQDAIAYQKTGKPAPMPASGAPPEWTPGPDVVPGAVRAFSENAINSVPVLGPMVHGLRNDLMGSQGGAEMDALGASASAANPLAATAGSVFGTVAPLMAGGATTTGAKLLGMSGNLATRIGMGALSGGVISGADALARGQSASDAKNSALIGGAVGGGIPIAGKVVGAGWNALMGPSGPQMVASALRADENSPAAITALLQQKGAGATIADLGPNTQGMATGLASLPGKPKGIVVNNLMARAADTGSRLAQDVAGTIGQGQPVGQLTDSIIAAQKAAADPLYAAVRTQPVQVTPALNAIAATPMGKAAFQQATTMMKNDGISPSSTVALYDYAKQALDDAANVAQRSGENNKARQAVNLANQLRSEVDSQVPAYAQARDAFAGPAKVLDAVEMGQNVFSNKTSPEDLQKALSGMSSSERDGMLAGAQAAVQKAIGSARTDAAGVKSLFDSNYGKEKLALLIGQPDADKIAAALERERAFSDTSGKAYKNSITSANAAQQKAINPEAAGFQGVRPVQQSSLGVLLSSLGKARRLATAAYRERQNVTAANLLTATHLPPGAAKLLQGGNALLAPASVPLVMNRQGVGPNNLLAWAQPAIAAGLPAVNALTGMSLGQ